MFVKGVHYKEVRPEVDYRLLRDCVHTWIRLPPVMSNPSVEVHRLDDLVSFDSKGVFLNAGYQWNGSNVVKDSPQCMRASAVHDAWCRGMHRGVLEDTKVNWDRGVEAYAAICEEDGLDVGNLRIREFFMDFRGRLKYR